MLLLFWRTSDAVIASPSITLAFGYQVVRDSFDRADTGSSGLGTADSGQAWANTTAGWGISGNTAKTVGGAAAHMQTVVDSGISDAVIQATISPADSTQNVQVGILFRATDATHWLVFYVIPNTTTARLSRMNGGAFTNIATATYTPSTSSVLKVICVGPIIQCFVDGVLVITATGVTDYQTITKHGLYARNQPAAQSWEDFSVARAVWAWPTLQGATASPGIRLSLFACANPFGSATPSITLSLAPSSSATLGARATPRITLALAPSGRAIAFARTSPRITLALAPNAWATQFAQAVLGILLALEAHAIGGNAEAGSTVIELEYNAAGSTVTNVHRIDYEQTGVSTIVLKLNE